jgi:hypothetical protein
MIKKIILNLAIIVVGLAALGFAQEDVSQQIFDPQSQGDATKTCSVKYSSGTGVNATQFCITANGHIGQFSIAGVELVAAPNNPIAGEGYGVCDFTPKVQYFDYGYGDSANWLSPELTQKGNVVTVIRKTSDGIWQLKQTLTNIPANAYGPASVKIAMALKNLSTSARVANLTRYSIVLNMDANGGIHPVDGDYTGETAYGLIPNFGRGLSTTNNTFDFSQAAFAQGSPSGPNPCSALAFIAAQPYAGNTSIVQFWTLTIPAHGSKTVISTYKPI